MNKMLTALQDVIDIQVAEPTVKKDPYMRGMANGLLCAQSVLTGIEPNYITQERLLKQLQETPFETEQEQFFEERTNKHIGLVKEVISQLVNKMPELSDLTARGEIHDASKFEEPERTPYISLTWRHKLEKENGEHDPYHDKGYQTPGMLTKEDENKATLHHVTTNSHHPEYHLTDKSDANIDAEDRDKSVQCIDASAMGELDVYEMVCDWVAMSRELGTNTARQWFDKQQGVRWQFSEHQVELIDKALKVLENE